MYRSLNDIVTASQRQVGDEVMYQDPLGTDTPRKCTITHIGEKNGRLSYINSLGFWGYPEQYSDEKP